MSRDRPPLNESEVDVGGLLTSHDFHGVRLVQRERVIVVLRHQVRAGTAGVHPVAPCREVVYSVRAILQAVRHTHHAIGVEKADPDGDVPHRRVIAFPGDPAGDSAARRQCEVNVVTGLVGLHWHPCGLLPGLGVVVELGQIVLLSGLGPHEVAADP